MLFEIYNTDIASVSADAVVLPANQYLKEGSGSSKAIFETAGRKQLTNACQLRMEKHGPYDEGSVTVTEAFSLDAEFIIHAVVPKWIDGESGEYDILCSTYLSSLKLADDLQCQTIAFPLLSSGNNGFDIELAFEIAKQSIARFEGMYLKKVILVVYGERITSLLNNKGYSVISVKRNLKGDSHRTKVDEKGTISKMGGAIKDTMANEKKRKEYISMVKDIVSAAIEIKGLIKG